MIVASFILFATLASKHEAAKILAIFPTPSLSHQVVFRPIITELINRGHEVTMLTTDPIFKKGQGPRNLTEIDVHNLSYKTYMDIMKHGEITTGNKNALQEQMVSIYRMMESLFEKQLLTEEMQRILKDKSIRFDLLMFEAYFSPLLALTHVYKNTPVIQISSLGTLRENLPIIGAPEHPFIHPSATHQRIYNLTFWDKISELYNYFRLRNTVQNCEDNLNKVLKTIIGNDMPHISELKNNVDLLFLNVHPIWEMNRPFPPNVVYMGGLHQKPEKELPEDLKRFLDSSRNGVIYVSFGTNVQPETFPPERIQTMINVFSKLPYEIMWKWNQDELPGKTENIKISKWFPQSDLLKHPKVKLFITQGGLQSTDEAITAGVPLLGIPMFTDQWYNVEQYVHHKIGLQLEMNTITEEKFGSAIKTIIDDKSYRDNIIRLRSLMRDQPQPPLERAMWWVEYLLRHGTAKHLRSPAANMSWAEYYEVKLVSVLLIAFFFIVTISILAIYYVLSLLKKYFSIKLKSS